VSAELAFVMRDCEAAAAFTSAEQASAAVAVVRELAEPVAVVAFGGDT
jgi:long-chain acyl-CoA synthetase